MVLVVDTSAVVCIAIGEIDAEKYVAALSIADTKLLPALLILNARWCSAGV